MGKITFIIGGARSGKSGHAVKMAGSRKTAFVATCQALDGEMVRRVKLHKKARPGHWKTFEEPLAPSKVIKDMGGDLEWIIVDCLTLLVSNLFLKKTGEAGIEKEVLKLLTALKNKKASSIIVSNEVGLGIVPGNACARDFRDIAGRMNQLTAQKADEVIFMVSGIPWRIK